MCVCENIHTHTNMYVYEHYRVYIKQCWVHCFYLDGWRNVNVWSTVAWRLAADFGTLPCAVFSNSFFFFSYRHCKPWNYTECFRLQSLSSPSLFLPAHPVAGPSIYQRPREVVPVKHTYPGLLSLLQRKFRKCVISRTFVHFYSRLEWLCPPEDSQKWVLVSGEDKCFYLLAL